MVKVINNFLPKIFFTKLNSIIYSNQFPWYYEPRSLHTDDKEGDKFMFVHSLLGAEIGPNGVQTQRSPYYPHFEPILYFIHEHKKIKNISRMKLNLYTNQNKNIEHTPHHDFTDNKAPVSNTAIGLLNFTSCNGGTRIDNKVYESISNQLIMFDNALLHSGITQTDRQNRIVLNIGWETNG